MTRADMAHGEVVKPLIRKSWLPTPHPLFVSAESLFHHLSLCSAARAACACCRLIADTKGWLSNWHGMGLLFIGTNPQLDDIEKTTRSLEVSKTSAAPKGI